MPGSTEKCPAQHESVAIAIIKHPPTSSEKYSFYFYSNILLLRTYREIMHKNEIILISKYIWYHYEIWNVIILSICDDHDVCSHRYMLAATAV